MSLLCLGILLHLKRSIGTEILHIMRLVLGVFESVVPQNLGDP